MAGHSHSKNVQHRKDRVNAKKAKAFSKVAKMITVAAKLGGGDVDANPRLRLAIEKGRMVSMPKDVVERAIKKGVGDTDLGNYEDVLYEGYGSGGVAVMLEVLTDNRNRTVPEVRKIFERRGGNLANSGAVAYLFERKASFKVVVDSAVDEDQLMEFALEAGAEDLVREGDHFEIRCEPGDFLTVQAALEEQSVPITGGEVGYFAKTSAKVESVEEGRKIRQLIDALEEHDDVQSVFSNCEFPAAVAAALAEEE